LTTTGDSGKRIDGGRQALAKTSARLRRRVRIHTDRARPQDPLIEMQNHEGVRVVLGAQRALRPGDGGNAYAAA